VDGNALDACALALLYAEQPLVRLVSARHGDEEEIEIAAVHQRAERIVIAQDRGLHR
jgi:hypothetical protein